jgi:DNA repair protein RadC
VGFILKEAQIVYKRGSRVVGDRKIGSSRDVVALVHDAPLDGLGVLPMGDCERFVAIALDAKGRVLGWSEIASGGLSSVIVDPRRVFRFALLAGAVSLIVTHNHPSGDATPSAEDAAITERLRSAGDLLGVTVLDHLIVTADPARYFSFLDSGMMGR